MSLYSMILVNNCLSSLINEFSKNLSNPYLVRLSLIGASSLMASLSLDTSISHYLTLILQKNMRVSIKNTIKLVILFSRKRVTLCQTWLTKKCDWVFPFFHPCVSWTRTHFPVMHDLVTHVWYFPTSKVARKSMRGMTLGWNPLGFPIAPKRPNCQQ